MQSHTLYDASDAKERTLCAQLARACLKNSRYDFVAGGAGGNFFDIDEYSAGREGAVYVDAQSRARELGEVFSAKVKKLSDQGTVIQRLGFIERDSGPVGMITYKDLIGTITGLETFCVRPRKRLLTSSLKGRPVSAGERVALISDVATTGEAILAAAEKIWQAGGTVSCAIVLYDRLEGATQYLAQYDIELFSVFDSNSFMEQGYIQEQPQPSTNVIQFVGVGMTR